MRDRDLGTVLMVKAFEEQDPEGTLLPRADREGASREAARITRESASASGEEAALGRRQQRLLVERSRILFARLAARHSVVETVRDVAGRFAGLGTVLAVLGLAAGAALSALDGPRRIEIFSFPLLGLIAWNLAVYLFLLVRALPRGESRPSRGLLAAALARFPGSLAARAIARSRAFDTTLAAALDRFVRSWFELAAPINRARAVSAIHAAAAAVGVGLVAGLYMRGLVLDYRAGWETTFLSAEQARLAVGVLYGPASWLSRIPLPDAAQLAAMRWGPVGSPGGTPAASWMHLIAITVALFVITPRVLLAVFATSAAWAHRRRMALPADLESYFRTAFSEIGSVVPRQVALVIPYANAMSNAALLRLVSWVGTDAGGNVDVEAADPVPYGEEQRYLAQLAERGPSANLIVLPFGLATTPENENHGAVLEGVRDWIAGRRDGARLMVVIDEGPFKGRMAAAPERVAERRELWKGFVAARGLEPRFVDLAP